MAKIDLEKLICSFIERTQYRHLIAEIQEALKDQGLECKEGQVVEIEYNCTGVGTQKEEEGVLKEMINKPLEIKAGHWYVCIKGYGFCEHDYLTFEKGKIYKSEKDKELTASDGGRWPFGDAKDYFRPATEDEIHHKPRFKLGDWVVHDMSDGRKVIRQIINMTDKSYILDGKDFNVFYFNDLENYYHLWTIADAKDGDVLVSHPLKEYGVGKQIFIFKKIGNRYYVDNCIEYYCNIQQGEFYINSQDCYMGTASDVFYPATTEQRDLLFQKMAEAGYEWDAETKKLIKLLSPADVGFEELGKIWEEEGMKRIQKPDLGNTNGTNTIKFEQPEKELTEFDSKLCELLQRFRSKCIKDTPTNGEIIEYVEAHANELLSLARKQIAEEVDVNYLVNSFAKEKTFNEIMIFEIYRQGILDTLERIKGK